MLSKVQFAGLSFAAAAAAAGIDTQPPTFARDVAPIFQAHCQECHRPGTAAPMSLISYEESRPWAKSIKERVATRQMPPWHLDRTTGIQQFENDRSLTGADIRTILRWVESGAPKGDAKDLPPPREWPSEETWQLSKMYGEPDMVIKSEPYTMPARGQDVWWKPYSTVPITEPRWVRAVEMRPGTIAGRKITHHSLAALDQTEPGLAPDDPANAAGLLMEWAIGKQYDTYRPNAGKLLLPGARVHWDIHMHAVGEAVRDHMELAIYLYPKGEIPKYRTRLAMVGTTAIDTLDIPPNSLAQTQFHYVLPAPTRLENFQPHMHLRGKSMTLEAILPDGTVHVISSVARFNFNWMNNYIYTEEAAPVLPKGTILRMTAWHDNTTLNPNNPDPNQWVGFGDRTVDEMAHTWVNMTALTEGDYQQWLLKHPSSAFRMASR